LSLFLLVYNLGASPKISGKTVLVVFKFKAVFVPLLIRMDSKQNHSPLNTATIDVVIDILAQLGGTF
jgi:hypothetical protein